MPSNYGCGKYGKYVMVLLMAFHRSLNFKQYTIDMHATAKFLCSFCRLTACLAPVAFYTDKISIIYLLILLSKTFNLVMGNSHNQNKAELMIK